VFRFIVLEKKNKAQTLAQKFPNMAVLSVMFSVNMFTF